MGKAPFQVQGGRGGWGLDDLRGLFQPKAFYDSEESQGKEQCAHKQEEQTLAVALPGGLCGTEASLLPRHISHRLLGRHQRLPFNE